MVTPYFAATFLEIATPTTIICTNRTSIAPQTKNTSSSWLTRSNFHFWCNFWPDSESGNSLVVVVVVVLVVVLILLIVLVDIVVVVGLVVVVVVVVVVVLVVIMTIITMTAQ